MNITLKIEKAVYEGYGLGFHEGRAVFVPFSVPGDILEAEIYAEKKNVLFGNIFRIIEPSDKRIKPLCPNFAVCGGCDYLNVEYDCELALKKEILKDSLSRIGKFKEDNIPDISVISGERFHYRTHAAVKQINGQTGFYKKYSNDLAPFPDIGCLLLSEPLINHLKNGLRTEEKEIKIAASCDNECISSLDKKTTVCEKEMGIHYKRDISLFFQSNRFLRSKMLEKVRKYSDLNSSDAFLDIGCGVGFFTLYLARYAGQGTGIDINSKSIKWAKNHADLNKCGNAVFRVCSASDINPGRERFSVIIADPPRAGLSAKARNKVKAMKPERIVYVSCSPSTFARDAGDFINNGYSMRGLTLIDMFPCTYHIEVIALFKKQ